MLNVKSFLAADFGATTLKLAEFEPNEAGGLRLKQYGFRSLGQEGLQEGTREAVLQKALQELLAEKAFAARHVNVCAPGFHVFSKFVKLPPVDTSKVTQIIQYEAQQNVPFPLEEVVWDYQILGAAPTGELEVLLVAIKTDVVENLSKTSDAAGLKLQLVDVSPAALANAFRYNYGDLEGCSMLLDIGAKTSNLLFFDKENVYARGINIGANSITAEFSKESKMSAEEAEELKINQGFVSLGGAYEEPEDPHQQAISKIARQVMTRLHIQVNQTIQFYRGQQGGAAPVRLFLSGGASTMPYTAQFFAEKLSLPVEYFNPLRNVQIDPGLNLEELAKIGHSMGEMVGLGLRNLAHCPVELNLMPKSSLQRREFGAKKPYLIATMGCLVAILLAFGFFYNKIAALKMEALDKLKQQLTPLSSQQALLERETRKLNVAEGEAAQLAAWIEGRAHWGNLLMELRRVLIDTERAGRQKLGTDTGIWIERFMPDCAPGVRAPGVAGPAAMQGGNPLWAPAAPAAPTAPTPPAPGAPRTRRGAAAGAAGAQGGADTCSSITLLCRGVDLSAAGPNANSDFAFILGDQLKTNSMFVSTNTGIVGNLVPEGQTFTVQVMVTLKRPLRF